jgi:hypothetical protein
MKLGKLIPAFFTGSPISLIAAGALVLGGMPGAPAMVIGYALGTGIGAAFLAWI